MSTELAENMLLEFLNAIEAGIASAKQLYKEAKGINDEKPAWNPEKIKWEPTEGASGPYERSEDVNSLDFKALLKDLAAHQCKLSKNGYFYWTFRNGYTVGRKKRQNGEAKGE
ncbi:MAG: hypothetical protein NWE99_04765 [Candidatus Bathyarchaeota archaeon]|nr:hypothetical protein [Candidatus Bathyarchaeota archaeon]